MPPEESEEEWMRELRELGESFDAELTPCPVCREPVKARETRCRLCGHSFVESIEPADKDTFSATLQSTLRTPEGGPAEEAPAEEMWEALEELIEIRAEGAEVARSTTTALFRWLPSLAMILVGSLVYAFLLSAGTGSLVDVAAMALGAILVVLGLNGLTKHVRLRFPREASLTQLAPPAVLLGIGFLGYVLPLALGGDATFALATMALGAILIVMGVNALADLFAAHGSTA